MKFKQHVSFSKEADTITIKVYRYQCPFCDALVQKPTPEEVRKTLILKEMHACTKNKHAFFKIKKNHKKQ